MQDTPSAFCLNCLHDQPQLAYEVLQILIEHGADINYAPEKVYGPCIFAAAFSGNIQAIELCLQQNAKINVLSLDGSSLLHDLTTCTSSECIDRLLRCALKMA